MNALTTDNARPTAIVISFTDMATDPRVHRQLAWLSDTYRVVAVGTGAPQVPGVEFHPVSVRHKTSHWAKIPSAWLLLTGQHEAFYWNHDHFKAVVHAVAHVQPDVVIANDLETLPAALKAAKGAPVVFDAHEYYPAQFPDSLVFRFVTAPHRWALCSQFMPQAAAVMTVCEGIAEAYRDNFRVDPIVVTNAPKAVPLTPHPTDPQRIRLIHHGATVPSRRIEAMIAMMPHLDERFSLDLMLLVSDTAYYQRLRDLAAPFPNVRFLEPVPMPEIATTIAEYDIGLYLLEPHSFNDAMSYPNKFFEFLQARLAIAIGPSPEMARLVRSQGCGVVADDFRPESLARALNRLSATDIDRCKAVSHELAQTYCAERNGEVVLALLEQLRHAPAGA